jgi:signal transduction histidine kinase
MARRPTRGDWVVAGVLIVLCTLAPRVGPPGPDDPRWVMSLGLALAVLQGLPTAWRRVYPSAVAVVVVSAYLAYVFIVDPVPPYAGWVVLFSVIVHASTRQRAAVHGGTVAVALLAGLAMSAVLRQEARNGLPTVLLLTVVVVLAAALTRAERGRVAALRERAASLEREQDAVREQAALRERLRVARDLHDVVGHGLSAISVQSGTARVALDAGELASARAALVNVERSSHEALQEMRQYLGVLRGKPALTAPGVADVDELIDHTAGIRATVGVCAYRIIQEALTNVAKHATDAAVTVSMTAHDNRLEVDVTDTGGDGRSPRRGAGHGLVGMRERVQALRGMLDAGPTGDGGWRVHALLPFHGGGER